MNIRIRYAAACLLMSSLMLAQSCETKENHIDAKELPHQLIQKLTDIIVVDIFTPPVASRIYANCSIALYEAIRFEKPGNLSIAAKLNGFDPMPKPDPSKSYNFTLAAIQSFCETAKKVTFSAAEVGLYQDSLIQLYSAGLSKEVIERSIAFGQQVADVVAKRLGADNYKETRGMERFEVKTDDKARWVPTLPDYADALEPHWSKMKTMVLKTADEFKALPYPAYSEDTGSAFYHEMKEVYEISRSMTDEQIDITLFWDDNPFVSRHKGHVMFQDKKMTPGGHWMAITTIACKKKQCDAVTSARAYALTSVGLYDAFISCWYEKYRSVRIRPQTAIERQLEEKWTSYLQTPPFPEYTSGHSTISASAAEVLTSLFGDNIAFTDSSELEYALPVRSFPSFRIAAEEASVSRVYGGIHFRSGCENGNALGKQVGQAVIRAVQ
jgi:hypothetical protein